MYKKKLKRREEKEENNKIKDPKTIEKGKTGKNQGVWSHRYIILTQNIAGGVSEAAIEAGSRELHISQPLWFNGKKKALDMGGPSLIGFIYFWGSNKKLRWAGGAQRAVWDGNELKKTGARSARRARAAITHQLYISSDGQQIEELAFLWPITFSHLCCDTQNGNEIAQRGAA